VRLIEQTFPHIAGILLWGLLASAAMAIILEFSRSQGISRISLPFLFGTFFSARRSHAAVLGLGLYFLGGWLFAYGYALVFLSLGEASWWLGALIGLLHGIFLLAVFLPSLPAVHPRMATEYDGPVAASRLEPPGFFGLNYGRQTPVVTLAGQTLYGLILGAFLPVGS
jgi:hypothetical protein